MPAPEEQRNPASVALNLLKRWTAPLLVVACACGTAWWLDRLAREDMGGRRGDRHYPDYYMENFTRTSTDEAGAPKDALTADRMVHFADDQSTELVRPRMEIYNGDPRPWQITADRGWVSGDNEVVILYGDVNIWRTSADGSLEVEVITRDLRILPEEKYAESDAATTIKSPRTVTHAVGMRADFGVNRLELLKDVRSRHDVATEG